jgi:alpha-ribazole phosphatase
MVIYLIRHPRPLISAGICYGQLDVDCEDPLAVAAQLKLVLPEGTPIISSPLQRARKLAEALAPQVRIDPRLKEISFGEWEGQPWSEIDRSELDAWAADVLGFKPPGGESVRDLQQRTAEFAATLKGSHLALVSHAGVLRALSGYWQGLPTEVWTQLKFDFGSITAIEV